MKKIELTDLEKEYLEKMKPVEDLGRSELGKEIIKGIALGGVFASLFIVPMIGVPYKWIEDLHKHHKRKLRDNLKRLEDRGYVNFDNNGKYFITSKGKLKLYEYQIEELTILQPKNWDKIWRIITFDVPEEKKNARMSLNKKLKELGFLTLQKSVYVYPYPCEKEFIKIGNFFGVEKNIIFIESIKISNERELIKKFNKNKIFIKK